MYADKYKTSIKIFVDVQTLLTKQISSGRKKKSDSMLTGQCTATQPKRIKEEFCTWIFHTQPVQSLLVTLDEKDNIQLIHTATVEV